ncbi:D-amino-acid transaminase [Roseibium litorale]|uniref:Probable branched-chain-amino-acid aminotransferase n=1 Tax=Roseibium litorale TaxID=2803841 RepID=A0ABR9CN53_9HYPH|nr:D-amino-acid transaminase [Roseibium litorale]MBD8891717.1 D-amino-acid transaminase [Roseibium litorale]
MRTVYLNGDYIEESEAKVSIFDRGFLFADAIYEVTAVVDGKLIDFPGHMERLTRSLGEINLEVPFDQASLLEIHRQVVARNNLREGLIYLQISRGSTGDRDFNFPLEPVAPTLVLFTQEKALIENPVAERGQKVILVEDWRWLRRDIKTVQLLYPAMAKSLARDKGADDAWMVENGQITEGCSNNAYIVTADGTLVTRALSNSILAGITRQTVLQCAAELQVKVEERAFSAEEIRQAREAFSTSASGFVNPVVQVDGFAVGDGKPGPVARRLREIYIKNSLATAIDALTPQPA